MARRGVTELLEAMSRGDAAARDELFAVVHPELRVMARRRLARDRHPATLDTEALVNEACLKLLGNEKVSWESRRHFFSVFAIAMRHIVVDRARRASTRKRKGAREAVALDDCVIRVEEQPEMLLALDEALKRLEGLAPRLSTIVELRFFGGLSVEEIAQALGVTDRTVKRDWRKARALLYAWLS